MLKKILYVSGRPGLYKLISRGKNALIIEAIAGDKKQFPIHSREKVTTLSDIAMYTDKGEVLLGKILNAIREKEKGGQASLQLKEATPDKLRAYMAEVLPDFDRNKVYPTDIKRLLNWYNMLMENGITDFSEEEGEESQEENSEESKEVPDAE